uniref:Polycystic kidney disease 1 like 2a n=1 Tax=Sphaeramia orbicularis TaxID=375764 RepID=A0A673B3V4_9TELE
MDQILLHLPILWVLCLLCCSEDNSGASVSCPENQKVFRNSCYEFVDLQLSFFSAQAWCEKSGGHLPFIPDAETQHFLQGNLDAEKDVWIGAAVSSPAEGSLSWLDGSYITYSYWAHRSPPGAACAHILKNSDYRWKPTDDCNSRLYFICQFESGRSIFCPDHSTALRCGSGEVIMIDGGFFGLQDIHYSHSTTLSPETPMMHQCSSMDPVNLVRAQCQGRQVCTVTGLQSRGEPCPWLGSCLSVDYRCKEGIVLSVDPVAAVFNAVTINIKWVLDFSEGDLTCSISLGDGHVIYQLESSVVHIYTHPNSFLVAVECTSHKVQVTAQKIISVQEPVMAFGEIKCHAESLSFNATNCTVLDGEPFQLQMEVKAGSNVTYRVQRQDIVLTSLYVLRGDVSHNITLTPEMVTQLGPGCHQLSLYASNMVTFPEVSTELQVCVVQKISGLQALVLGGRSLYSSYVNIRVTLERGTPVLLQFVLTGEKMSYYESRQMNKKTEIYQIGHKVKGMKNLEINKGLHTIKVNYNGYHRVNSRFYIGNISGPIAALSLATKDGSGIAVQDLTEDIEVSCVNHTVDLQKDGFFFISLVWKKLTPHLLCLLSYDCYHLGFICDSWCCVFHKEEKYTWLIDPKMLKGNTGLHYLLVRPIVGPGIKFITANLSITSISTMCKFWNESLLEWSHNGCRVGIQTTPLTTQCLCNHLTFFGGSFFVTPNLVDPSRSAELFGTFAENPVVVCFVGALFVAYLLVVVWARRKDIQDTAKVKVTVLDDNDPLDEYRYLLSVSTGHRRGASTSSQVAIILLGSEGNSGVHHLTDPQRSVFERGAVDLFLLTTPFCLGDLQGIRLWHNNTGSHPAWFLSSVIVQDLQSEQKWHFICNSWLSIDMDDCSLDKMFPVSSEMEMKRFSNLFFMKTAKDFSDGHLWYSVISRPPRSSFTCVQRVSCCFSLLLCTMLTSIMFYGIPTDPSEQTMDLGHFEFTWQQFMIGVQSSLIMFPVNILMVSIFRQTRPRETPCCKHSVRKAETERSFQPATTNMNTTVTLDTVIKDITRIAHSLSKTVKSNIPCKEAEFRPGQDDINAVLSVVEDFIRQNKTSDTSHCKTHNTSTSEHPGTMVEGIQKKSNKTQYLYQQLCRIETELGLLRPTGFPNPHSYSQALQQVQGMKAVLEDHRGEVLTLWVFSLISRSSPSDTTGSVDGQRKRGCFQGGLPWWFVFFGWLLVAGTSVVAGYFTMLYGLKFGKERSVSWLVSMIVSFFQSMFIIQPLKVLGLAVFFALVIKKVDDENFENIQFARNDKDEQMVRKDSSLYEPPPPADVEKMKMIKMKEQKAFNLLTEILMYMGFMWMLLLVAYGQRDPNAFYLNRHIRNSFSSDTSDSMSLSDVFTWANTSLLHNLFGVYPGFITDGNSRLVGSARLRQLRVQVNSCQVPDLMLSSVPGCYGPYSWDLEDSGSYDPGWNRSVNRNASTGHVSPWTYQTQAQLRAQPVWGNLELYRGGGFVAELGPTSQNASRYDLFRNKWLDMHTRAVFAEFTVYNANVNLFCIVTLLFENTATGAFQFESFLQSIRLYQSTGGLHIFVMAAEIIYLLFILYYMFIQGKLMKVQRWSYFKSKWNLVELTIILLSWAAVAVFIKRTLIGNRDTTYYQKHRDQFASFYETASADSVLQYLISFLVLLSTIKLWHLLRLNPKMNMITATLQRAWTDISGFLVVIVIMLLAYSIGFNVIYGWKLSSYKTFLDALMTIISLQIGIFNYSEVLDQNPVLGAFFIGSCIVFMTFVVLNLFVSVILVSFNEEQTYHKVRTPSHVTFVLFFCFLFQYVSFVLCFFYIL